MQAKIVLSEYLAEKQTFGHAPLSPNMMAKNYMRV